MTALSPRYRQGTRCVWSGGAPVDVGDPLVPPLVQSTTSRWQDLDHPPARTYARSGNPTAELLEARLSDLEGGAEAVSFSSGLAAIDALCRAVPRGGRIVAGRHLYGGTIRLLQRLHADGRRVDLVESTSGRALRDALATPAALVVVESPSNPTLQITDIELTAELAHRAGAVCAVDNTLLTPLYQQPLRLGADVVVHSTTKYLDGHDATLGGALVVGPAHAGSGESPVGPLAARFRWIRKATGAPLAPFEAWLTLQGIKTLHLRTAAQWSAASHIAQVVHGHPSVRRLHYPGLGDHPGREVHRRQATGDGGLLSLDLGTLAAARAFVSGLEVFAIAENLGPTESIATHPASMTHVDLAPAHRRADGISDGLVRLSCGVEDPADLEADVVGALDALAARPEAVA